MLFWLKLPTSSYAMYCFEMILDTVPNTMRGRLTGTANCDSAKVCEGRNSNKPTAYTLKCFDRKHSQHSREIIYKDTIDSVLILLLLALLSKPIITIPQDICKDVLCHFSDTGNPLLHLNI